MQNWIVWNRTVYLCKNGFDVGANVLECDVVVNEFELQLQYYFHFQTNAFATYMNPLIPPPPAMC